MEFDISRVYTAVNADELKIGSKFIGADNLAALKQKVHYRHASDIYKLKEVLPENSLWRFHGICRPFYLAPLHTFCLAYLIDEPDEKKLKWTDLNVGDVIRCHNRKYMIVAINYCSDSKAHVRTYKGWLTDEELENFKKV